MNIIQKPSPNFQKKRNGYTPEVIVLHIMDGSLVGTDNWFSSAKAQVSSHFGIGLEGEVHQYVNTDDTAWGNGIVNSPSYKLYKKDVNPNLYTISIEHEGRDLANAPEAQINASIELIQSLSKKYNIPIDRDHIIGHYEIDHLRKPNCPSVDRTIVDTIVRRAAPKNNNQEIVKQIQELLNKIS